VQNCSFKRQQQLSLMLLLMLFLLLLLLLLLQLLVLTGKVGVMAALVVWPTAVE
jgi:hypothetical protein